MGDVFKEQLVPMTMSKNDKAQKGIIWTVAVLVSLILFFVLPIFMAPILVLAVLWLATFLSSKLKKEHEYSLTNNLLDIDVIYNKEKRKRVIELDLKEMNAMASIKDERHQDELARGQKVINASDGNGTKETYAIMYPKDGQLQKILITPNEEMLNLMYKQAPNKVFKYRG
ncbi:hypothetical protein PBV87_06065 [Niameybacter massiliensis]|uniref:Uncharacterized protein n=1 Tax=Holtiella tumoricola TaxID=3018743 RepID=A0AA42DLV8_9FIRM|nr:MULTISPECIES: hypothetical protein [Lachnospirales]MDA3731053.1 hypothetical protein [Holtiella tumoricola]